MHDLLIARNTILVNNMTFDVSLNFTEMIFLVYSTLGALQPSCKPMRVVLIAMSVCLELFSNEV